MDENIKNGKQLDLVTDMRVWTKSVPKTPDAEISTVHCERQKQRVRVE
jgi:hypothetical protein